MGIWNECFGVEALKAFPRLWLFCEGFGCWWELLVHICSSTSLVRRFLCLLPTGVAFVKKLVNEPLLLPRQLYHPREGAFLYIFCLDWELVSVKGNGSNLLGSGPYHRHGLWAHIGPN